MDYAIFPHDVEFNRENFREARRDLDQLAASITCINVMFILIFSRKTIYPRKWELNYAVELFEFAPLILSTSTSTGRNERKSNGWKSKCDVKRRESRIREKKSKETMLGEKNSLVDTQWSPGRRSGSIVKTERVSYRSLFLVHSLPNIFRIPRRTKDATRIHRSTCLPSTRFIQSYLVFSDISNNLRDFLLWASCVKSTIYKGIFIGFNVSKYLHEFLLKVSIKKIYKYNWHKDLFI